jgi:hypothetical protein
MTSTAAVRALPIRMRSTQANAVATDATRPDPHRRRILPPTTATARAPTVYPAIARPKVVFVRSRESLISGYRGTMFANAAPLRRNNPETARRARRWGARIVLPRPDLVAVSDAVSVAVAGNLQPQPRDHPTQG